MRHKKRIGNMTVPGYERRQAARVEWEVVAGEFTMSGSIGPRICGQCIDEIADAFLDHEEVQRMRAIWKRWHLNSMHPHCIHQRARWDGRIDKKLTVHTYRLHMSVMHMQDSIKKHVLQLAGDGEIVQLTDNEQFILSLPWEVKVPGEERYAYMREHFSEWYRRTGQETKTAGWLYESEHPEGLLGKVCPVCGYNAGSAWLKEELPAEVLAEIESWSEED